MNIKIEGIYTPTHIHNTLFLNFIIFFILIFLINIILHSIYKTFLKN